MESWKRNIRNSLFPSLPLPLSPPSFCLNPPHFLSKGHSLLLGLNLQEKLEWGDPSPPNRQNVPHFEVGERDAGGENQKIE